MYAYRTPAVYFEWLDDRVVADLPRLDVAGFVGFAERGPLHRPVRIDSVSQFFGVFGRHVSFAYLAYAVEGFFDNGGDACWVVRVDDPATARCARVRVLLGAHRLQLVATSTGAWGNGLRVRGLRGGPEGLMLHVSTPDGLAQSIRTPLAALHACGRPDDRRTPRGERRDVLDADFELLVRVERDTEAGVIPSLAGDGVAFLAGGVDGLASVTAAHFMGDPTLSERPLGWQTLEPIAEIGLLAAPDVMPSVVATAGRRPRRPPCTDLAPAVPAGWEPPTPLRPASFDATTIRDLQNEMIAHCERTGHRLAILDAPDVMPDAVEAVRRDFGDTDDVAALYYPWLLVRDPLELTGVVRAIPPSGHVAGIYARVDRTQGVHEAPANEVVEAAAGVTQRVDDALHGDLNTAGINVVRVFAGGGIRVAGARTLYRDPLLRYVSVRRLLFLVEKAIEQGTQWIVFEPNDDATRRDTDRVVRSIVARMFGRGMLDGTSAAEAFFVRCDATNNPPESVDRGQLVCEVGVRPPWPAEFVVVRITKTHSGTEVQEEGGQIDG